MNPPSLTRPTRGPGWWASLVLRYPASAAIFAATTVMFALQHVLGSGTDTEVLIRLGALVPERVRDEGELFRLLTPMLLHVGWIHFGLNMFAFAQLGILTEHLLGRSTLVAAYVLSGLGAATCTALLASAWVPASVGASGAILGIAGLLLGLSWYGREPWRTVLRRLLGRSLWVSVAITFALGLGVALIVPLVDNWGHLGGLLTGLALAGLHRAWWPDLSPRGPNPTPILVQGAAALGVGAWVIAVGWMGIAGNDAVEDEAEPGRGGVRTAMAITRDADALEEEGRHEDALRLLERRLPHLKAPDHYAIVARLLEELDHPLAALETMEVLLEVHDTPDALNIAAWHLVTTADLGLRDPERAEALSRRSLDRLGDPPADDPGAASWREQRAAYLDTLAEALIQQGRFAEAAPLEREAVRIATEDALEVLGELTARLRRIEGALDPG